jgi:hypothetical protein
MAGVKVAYDRTRNHHAGTRAQRLQHSKADQHVDIRCEGAPHAADGEDRETDINRHVAAEYVREWPVNELADAQRDEKHHEAHLHRSWGGVQRAPGSRATPADTCRWQMDQRR